jgi:O-antigen/teichoic acid export membrane protein
VILALGSVHAVLLPVTQKIEDIQRLRATFGRYLKLVAMIVPVILLGAWASRWIIPAIDTGKYPEAVTVFRILAVSAVISIAFSPFVNLVMKFERFRFLFFLVSGAIALSIGLNLLLVPGLGAIGTAISTLISFGLVNSLIFLKARALLRLRESSISDIITDSANIHKMPEVITT